MRAEQVQDRRRIDELENRLMLIEDRLETRRLAEQSEGRLPVLPVVRIAPPAVEGASPDQAASEDGKHGEPRPLLKLHGKPRRGRKARPPVRAEVPSANERLPVAPLPPRPAMEPSQDPLRWYRKHHELVLAAKYHEAQAGLERFLRDWPDHDYADNAAYWIGECHYARADWPRALEAFRLVVDRYPRGNKAPGALLKLGYTYLQTGDRQAAVAVLRQVVETYARAEVAKLARAKLEEIHD